MLAESTYDLNEEALLNTKIMQETPAAEVHVPSEKSWKAAHRAYHANFVQVVTRKWAIFSWIYELFEVENPDPRRCGVRISIAEMQRMYLTALKYELADIGFKLRWPTDLDETTKRLTITLEKYSMTITSIFVHYYTLTSQIIAQAVRDYDFMTTALQNPLDAFVISSEMALDRVILQTKGSENRILMKHICTRPEEEIPYVPTRRDLDASFHVPDEVIHTGPWEKVSINGRVKPTGGTRGSNVRSILKRAFWWRLGAAPVGAAFLIGPLWFLSLRKELYLQLGATTGFMLGFAFITAFFVEKADQVFAGTLAYAAVLMVFVGVTLDK